MSLIDQAVDQGWFLDRVMVIRSNPPTDSNKSGGHGLEDRVDSLQTVETIHRVDSLQTFPCQAWFGGETEGVEGGVLTRCLTPAHSEESESFDLHPDLPMSETMVLDTPLRCRVSGMVVPHPEKVPEE